MNNDQEMCSDNYDLTDCSVNGTEFSIAPGEHTAYSVRGPRTKCEECRSINERVSVTDVVNVGDWIVQRRIIGFLSPAT